MNQKNRSRLFLTSLILLVLAACNTTAKYHEGLNVIYRNGKPCEELYVSNHYKNGIYIKFSDSPYVIQTGTYLNNMRNGLWDTILPGEKELSQIFYVNDRSSVIMNRYPFQFVQSHDLDLVFLRPTGWDMSDSTAYHDPLIAFRSYPKTYDGQIQPACLISKLNSDETVLNIFKSKVNPNDSSFFLMSATTPNQITYEDITPSDTIVCCSKAIYTKKSRFCMALVCSKRNYTKYYQYVYKTILNSYNPISDIKQKSDDVKSTDAIK